MLNNNLVRDKSKGFMLIEAILATALISSAVLFKVQYENEQRVIDEMEAAALELNQFIQAFDNHTVYDGYVKESGTWEGSWDGTSDVFDMFRDELVGWDSDSCDGNWQPQNPDNSKLSLIPCSLISGGRAPANFTLSAKRTKHETFTSDEGEVLGEWSITAQHDADQFEKYFKHYPRLLNQMRARVGLSSAGLRSIDFYNTSSNELIDASECMSVGYGNCAIKATWSNLIQKQTYLRVDGSKPMEGAITFRHGVNTNVFRCVDAEHEDVPCGIDFDEDGVVTASLDNVALSNLVMTHGIQNGRSIAPVECRDFESGSTRNCGFMTVENNGTYLAKAHLNALHTADLHASNVQADTLNVTETIVAKTASLNELFVNGGVTAASATIEGNVDSKSVTTESATLDKIFARSGNVHIDAQTLDITGSLDVRGGSSSTGHTFKEYNSVACTRENNGEVRRMRSGTNEGVGICAETTTGSNVYQWQAVGSSGEVGQFNINLVGTGTFTLPDVVKGSDLLFIDGSAHPVSGGKTFSSPAEVVLTAGAAQCGVRTEIRSCNISVSDTRVVGCSYTENMSYSTWSHLGNGQWACKTTSGNVTGSTELVGIASYVKL
ncbi:hypothetical protein ACPV5R_18660 [Vibrio astriarenae]